MGSGLRGNYGNTSGAAKKNQNQKDTHKSKEKAKEKVLINELKKNNIKFNKKDMKFITKDKSGQTVWLEKGNSSAGLKHIIDHHEKDFKNAYNISKKQIPSHIKKVITNGKIISQSDSGIGYTKVYKYNSKYYLVTGIGYNGFIVSAFPYDDKGGKYDKD